MMGEKRHSVFEGYPHLYPMGLERDGTNYKGFHDNVQWMLKAKVADTGDDSESEEIFIISMQSLRLLNDMIAFATRLPDNAE